MNTTRAIELVKRVTYRPGWAIAAAEAEDGGLLISVRAPVIDAAAKGVDATVEEEPPDWLTMRYGAPEFSRRLVLRHRPENPPGAWLNSKIILIGGHLERMGEEEFISCVRGIFTEMELHERDEFLRLDGELISDPHAAT